MMTISVSRVFRVTLDLRERVEVSLTEIEAKWLHRELGIALGASAASADPGNIEAAFDVKKFLEGAPTTLVGFPGDGGEIGCQPMCGCAIKYPSNEDQVQSEPETVPPSNDRQQGIAYVLRPWEKEKAKDYDHDSQRISSMLRVTRTLKAHPWVRELRAEDLRQLLRSQGHEVQDPRPASARKPAVKKIVAPVAAEAAAEPLKLPPPSAAPVTERVASADKLSTVQGFENAIVAAKDEALKQSVADLAEHEFDIIENATVTGQIIRGLLEEFPNTSVLALGNALRVDAGAIERFRDRHYGWLVVTHSKTPAQQNELMVELRRRWLKAGVKP